ncbi:MAG: hypothetical protein ABIQ31_05985, partial [Ferruginibacter sp.]
SEGRLGLAPFFNSPADMSSLRSAASNIRTISRHYCRYALVLSTSGWVIPAIFLFASYAIKYFYTLQLYD